MRRHPTGNSSHPPTTINRKDYHGEPQRNTLPCGSIPWSVLSTLLTSHLGGIFQTIDVILGQFGP